MNCNKPMMGMFLGLCVLVAGCATEKTRTAAPLFFTAPQITLLPELKEMELPEKPDIQPVQLRLVLPQTQPAIGRENSVFRRGADIEGSASVVINVPSWMSGPRDMNESRNGHYSQNEFSTADNFHLLEQFVEKGLLLSGFHVKDRSKFEAKLRDMRDAEPQRYWRTSADADIGSIKNQLEKELKSGEISMDEYTDRLVQAREQLSDKRYGKNRTENEVSDISELIRAAQDGDVQADFILQVNDLAISLAPSTRKINIKDFSESSAFLDANPGLRVSDEGRNDSLPGTIPQRWMVAIFNAKLINVKTGSIDWIGEYSIDSRAVLADGIQIKIDVRKETTNDAIIEETVESYNDSLRNAYMTAKDKYRLFVEASQAAAAEISYYGLADDAETQRLLMQDKYTESKEAYTQALDDYEQWIGKGGKGLIPAWQIQYLVDTPHIDPDFTTRDGAGSPEQLMEHFRKLGSRITIDLISSIGE